MPLYNKRNFVRRAVESVSDQTYPNWELIVVDDGSSDGSVEQIPQSNNKIKILSQENAGPAAARNLGIKHSDGQLISFIDADNYYYPNKLKTEIEMLTDNSQINWMVSTYHYKKKDHNSLFQFTDIKGNRFIANESAIVTDLLTRLEISNWHIEGLCIKKDLLNRVGRFNENLRCYEITEFLIRCALKQPTVLCYCKPLFCVEDTPNSAFKIRSHRISGWKHIGESLYDLAKEYGEYSHYLKTKSRESMLFYAAGLIISGKNRKARNYLTTKFPHSRTMKWWKLWLATYLPKIVLRKYKWKKISRNFS